MSSYLPKEVREGLNLARKRDALKKNRLKVRIGESSFPIRTFGERDFTLAVEDTPNLRGLVDIFDGGRHLYQALIVTAALDGPEMRYEFKRVTEARETPPLDYDRDEAAPVALLPRH
ncbi:hypothetical protein [Tropicimonas sp. S265A]|uniref:hypothetical protein n=1 Tax=Tropicimonas sp. S265A TaxID=3415134 RepID=UPI003C7A3ECA